MDNFDTNPEGSGRLPAAAQFAIIISTVLATILGTTTYLFHQENKQLRREIEALKAQRPIPQQPADPGN